MMEGQLSSGTNTIKGSPRGTDLKLFDITKAVIVLLTVKSFLNFAAASSLFGLTNPKCFQSQDMICPNKNVTFWLYTNVTRDSPILLDPLNLRSEDFDRGLPIKIVIHGYTGNRNLSPNSHIRPALLQHEDVYVISVDYGPLVPEPCYAASVANVPLVSQCLGQLINNLVSEGLVANEDIHLIGFSLGAQVAGQTANYLHTELERITGLDPARPLFISVPEDKKLDPSDAKFVDVIHTDTLVRGMLRSTGHVDFYPNIGQAFQPGCETDEAPSSCSHDRAPQFYAESIYTHVGFWSYACPNWPLKTFCNDKGNDALMGYYVDKSLRGAFFLQTAREAPYALGRNEVIERSQNYLSKMIKQL